MRPAMMLPNGVYPEHLETSREPALYDAITLFVKMKSPVHISFYIM
jgi:hypothetical protein